MESISSWQFGIWIGVGIFIGLSAKDWWRSLKRSRAKIKLRSQQKNILGRLKNVVEQAKKNRVLLRWYRVEVKGDSVMLVARGAPNWVVAKVFARTPIEIEIGYDSVFSSHYVCSEEADIQRAISTLRDFINSQQIVEP